jgi:hypothetical protein
LIKFLKRSTISNHELDHLPPVIIFAFDEAHKLTEVNGNEKPWSRFGELRRNIRKLKPLPVVSLFISTVSRISDLTPVPKQDMSARIVNETLTLLPPFTGLGFDHLLEASPIEEDTITIGEVSQYDIMCKFGRPLFVAIFLFPVLLMRSSFGARFGHGGKVVQSEIVEFAASKLICGESKTELDDDQKLGMENHSTPFLA